MHPKVQDCVVGEIENRASHAVSIRNPADKGARWQDDKGAVWIAYNATAYLKSRHGIGDRGPVFGKMKGALGKLTDAAIAE